MSLYVVVIVLFSVWLCFIDIKVCVCFDCGLSRDFVFISYVLFVVVVCVWLI